MPRGRRALRSTPRPLEEILVEHSSYSRNHLKARLYLAGLKAPVCELCGQDETWRGKRMGLILDHVNGVRDDNRLENLRIVCPNCAATLETHCGRKNLAEVQDRACLRLRQHVSAEVLAPPLLLARLRHARAEEPRRSESWHRAASSARRTTIFCARSLQTSWSAVGRRYGVSDNAVRKWVRQYEREQAAGDGC